MKAHNFDPLAHCARSDGQFPYTIPLKDFTATDEKTIKKGAKPDRRRIHKLGSEGGKSSTIEFYERQCQRGQEKVYQERVGHAQALLIIMVDAQSVIDSPEPPILDDPEGTPPPSGTARQQWYNQQRRADESRAEWQRWEERVREAEAEFQKAKTQIVINEHYFNLALSQWNLYFDALKSKHMDYAIGTSGDPVLIRYRTRMADYQLPPPVAPLSFEEHSERTPEQLTSRYGHDSPDEQPDSDSTGGYDPTYRNNPSINN